MNGNCLLSAFSQVVHAFKTLHQRSRNCPPPSKNKTTDKRMGIIVRPVRDTPCQNLFYSIEVRDNGFINFCSPCFLDYSKACLGSLFEENFENLWNGEKARSLRRLALAGQYPHCRTTRCSMLTDLMFKPDVDVASGFSEIIPVWPTHVVFTHDNQCNVSCIFCRDCLLHHSAEKIREMDSRIESHFLPLLKNAKVVKLQGAGEVFASPHSRKLVLAIGKRWPDVRFHIQSNGTLFNRKNCDALALTDRLRKAVVCAHAATEKTYNAMVKGGDFEAVLKNLEWLGFLKANGVLPYFYLGFVVTALNYREMKDYIQLARSVGAESYFVQLRLENDSTIRSAHRLAITDERHPHYNDFVHMLEDDIFLSSDCHMDTIFKNLKPSMGIRKRIFSFMRYYGKEAQSFGDRIARKRE